MMLSAQEKHFDENQYNDDMFDSALAGDSLQ